MKAMEHLAFVVLFSRVFSCASSARRLCAEDESILARRDGMAMTLMICIC
jgi:hypothetical protein